MESAAQPTPKNKVVEVRRLVKHFAIENSDDVVQAVDDVSFDIISGRNSRPCGRIRLREIYRRPVHAAPARTD